MDPQAQGQTPLATYGRRNIFYLRVSPTLVLPCILYLDPRHVRWLNSHPSVFHTALQFLKKRILTKLDREAKVIRLNVGEASGSSAGSGGKRPYREKRIWGEISGKEVVDVARQPEYHLAYFFRKQTERHSVLIKDKQLLFPKGAKPDQGKYAVTDPLSTLGNEDDSIALDDDAPPIQVKRDPEEEEAEMVNNLHADAAPIPSEITPPPDEKPKFKLRVRYKGFRIFTKSLILVLEPSPTARARSPDLFVTQQPQSKRQLSATPTIHRGGTVYADDPRPQSVRNATRDPSQSATPAPLFFRGASATPSEPDFDDSEARRQIRPPNVSQRQRSVAKTAGIIDDEQDEGEVEHSSDWAERIRSQSIFNGSARTLGDHEGVWNGEARDEYAQMMEDVVGGGSHDDMGDD